MIVCLPTIMHTGTQLMVYGLFKEFTQAKPDTYWKFDGDIIVYKHVGKDLYGDWFGLLRNPIVVPLRHPARVLESFQRRGRNIEHYLEQWEVMINEVHRLNPMYIHIDSNIRDSQVNAISKVIGKDLNIDWSEVIRGRPGTEGTHNMELPGRMPELIPQHFIDFYQDTRQQR